MSYYADVLQGLLDFSDKESLAAHERFLSNYLNGRREEAFYEQGKADAFTDILEHAARISEEY